MSRTIEVQTRKTRQSAQNAADRLNADAFPGQRYSVERVDARQYAVVLFDGQIMPDAPSMLSRTVRRPQTQEQADIRSAREFAGLSGRRMHANQRGNGTCYNVIG